MLDTNLAFIGCFLFKGFLKAHVDLCIEEAQCLSNNNFHTYEKNINRK